MNLEPVAPFSGGTISMVRGKTRRFRFQVQDRQTNATIDVTAWSKFTFLAKTNVLDTDGAAVVSKSLGSGIAAVQAPSGLMEVLISPSDTLALADTGQHLFAEIQGIDPTGLAWPLWQGELNILPTATQAST